MTTISFIVFFFFSAFPTFFQFFFSVVYLSHRRSAWIQKVIKQNVIGEPKNLRSYPVLDPIGHFGVLHVVWTCRRWANVPGMARLYSIYCCVCFVSPQLTRIMYCRMFLQIITSTKFVHRCVSWPILKRVENSKSFPYLFII